MRAMRSKRALAALLALLVATAGPPGGGRAAEGVPPDLEIKYVGKNPNNGAELMFRVANVGKWWVGETEATVETVVGPRNPGLTVRVPDLGPKGDPDTASEFEFAYEAICSQGGLKLKASLTTAVDWGPEAEINLANNTWEDWICQPYQGRPAPAPAANPAPGPKTDMLAPSAVKSVTAGRSFRAIVEDTDFSSSLNPVPLVGWGQNENKALLGADYVWVAETAVKFDLSPVVSARGIVHEAWLSYKEERSQWTNGAGQTVDKPGCVAELGRATSDWANAAGVPPLFQHESLETAPPGKKVWDVKNQVLAMVNNPQEPSLHHGFVLRGGMYVANLRGEDDTRCESKLSGIELKILWSPRS